MFRAGYTSQQETHYTPEIHAPILVLYASKSPPLHINPINPKPHKIKAVKPSMAQSIQNLKHADMSETLNAKTAHAVPYVLNLKPCNPKHQGLDPQNPNPESLNHITPKLLDCENHNFPKPLKPLNRKPQTLKPTNKKPGIRGSPYLSNRRDLQSSNIALRQRLNVAKRPRLGLRAGNRL